MFQKGEFVGDQLCRVILVSNTRYNDKRITTKYLQAPAASCCVRCVHTSQCSPPISPYIPKASLSSDPAAADCSFHSVAVWRVACFDNSTSDHLQSAAAVRVHVCGFGTRPRYNAATYRVDPRPVAADSSLPRAPAAPPRSMYIMDHGHHGPPPCIRHFEQKRKRESARGGEIRI